MQASVASQGQKVPAKRVTEPTLQTDDLTKIRGIGPATAALLQAAGIVTFADLNQAGTPRLQEILVSGGAKFAALDPSMWCRQAEFAISSSPAARIPEQTLVLDTESSVETGPVSQPTPALAAGPSTASANSHDDLTKIAGIGPITQELLRKNGIERFEQLGQMTADQLKEVFANQDSRFQSLNVTTWPVQARALTTDLPEESSVLDQVNSIIDMAKSTSATPAKSEVRAVDATKETSKQ